MLKYWEVRSKARDDQNSRGVNEPGERAGVTGGGHLDHVAHMLAQACIAAGAPPTEVYYKAPKDVVDSGAFTPGQISPGFTLPGFYRPTKMWDVVVRADGKPVVAIELKSQLGPSYGNNANNRAEEAIGTATDLTKAVERGLLPDKPWTGYVYIIEDDPASRERSRARPGQMFHPKDSVYESSSYQDRVRILCQRLVEEQMYDSTWAVTTSRPHCPQDTCPYLAKKFQNLSHDHAFGFRELDPEAGGYEAFIESFSAVIRKHYPPGHKRAFFRTHPDRSTPTLYDFE